MAWIVKSSGEWYNFHMEEYLKRCRLCPRECGADRANGEKGMCGAGGGVKVARAALHFWEEPCISGEKGSGTVFFSCCPLHCVYCQNAQISSGAAGKEITTERLAEIFLELQEQGAHNVNLVTPTQYALQIISAAKLARRAGLRIPFVYNCGGYESVWALKMLEETVDVYLTDFKYMGSEPAKKYSHAQDYAGYAKTALAEMVRQAGRAVFGANGILQKGVIVRHLMLPGQLRDSKAIVEYLYRAYGDDIYISLMNQYTPMPGVPEELRHKVKNEEYEELIDFAVDLGIENGFVQEGNTADESFIPPFDLTGVELHN